MRIMLVYICVVSGVNAFGGVNREFSGSVHALHRELRDAALVGVSEESLAKLRALRKRILDYTREHAAGRFDRFEWAEPFFRCHQMSLKHEFKSHAQAESGLREAMETLKSVSADNAALVADTAGRLAMYYAEAWMMSNARECVRLLDENEEWVLVLPGGREAWYMRTRYTQANLLLEERQFDEREREWLWSSRNERLRAYVEEEVLPLEARSRVVTHWGNVLYRRGFGLEAERLFIAWWKEHGKRIENAEFFEKFMRMELFEKGDWEMAGRLLEQANGMAHKWSKTSERAAYERMAWLYFESLFLAEYELKRVRAMEMLELRKDR